MITGQPMLTYEAGAIHLRHATAFGEPTSATCLDFIARLVELTDVRSIEITHPAGRATIRFDEQLPTASMLQRLANALRASTKPTLDDNLHSLLTFAPERDWTRVYRRGELLSVWQMTRTGAGQLCLQHEIVTRASHVAERLCRELAALPQVEQVTSHPPTGRVIIELANDQIDHWHLLQLADEIAHDTIGADLPDAVRGEIHRTLSRVQRGLHLALAGASFGMAIVGVAVPGIPTVPFLLVTSFFLVRSSPSLNDRLLRSRLFGPMMRDWQQNHGMRRSTKWRILAFTGLLVLGTLVFIQPPPALIGVMVVFTGLSVFFIARIPTIPDESSADSAGNYSKENDFGFSRGYI